MAEEIKNQDENKEAPSGKNPILLVLVLLNTVSIAGVGYFQFLNHKKLNSLPTVQDIMQQAASGDHAAQPASDGHGGDAKADPKAAGAGHDSKNDGMLYPLDPFTANLTQGSGPQRFIRVGMVLKFNKEAKKEELDARKPQINDTIISMLNSKKAEELLKKEGKEYLKEEIKSAINTFLTDGQMVDIFYVNFQIN